MLIPTVGRKDLIRTLESLRKQTISGFQVIVVYDGGMPAVPSSSDEVFIQGEGSHGPSLQKGLLYSESELVAIVDDDAVLPPNWIEHALGDMTDPSVAFAGGPNLTPDDSSHMERLIGHVQSSYFGSFRMATRYNTRQGRLTADETDVIATGVYRRRLAVDAYNSLGNSMFGSAWENILLTWMTEHGFLLRYDPELYFFHRRRASLTSFFRQVFKSGSGRARYFRVHPRQIMKKSYMMLPSLFIVYLFILPFMVGSFRIMILPLVLYVIAALAVSVGFSLRNRDVRAAFLIPVLLLTNHIAYGSGFLYGLLGKAVRTWGLK